MFLGRKSEAIFILPKLNAALEPVWRRHGATDAGRPVTVLSAAKASRPARRRVLGGESVPVGRLAAVPASDHAAQGRTFCVRPFLV